MNGHTWEVTLDQLRAEHRVEISHLATGSRWHCSCGQDGTGNGSPGQAIAGSQRHLRAAHRRIMAQFGRV